MTHDNAERVGRMVGLRRDLHRHPELSGEERRSADRIAVELDDLGVAYRAGVGGHGIVGEIPGRDGGPTIALRADIDALPIHEETGLEFASQVDGVMHACGHDGHTAMLVGAAELLLADPAPGPTRLIFQPAEERGPGASAMIAADALEGVTAIFAGHLDRHYPPGTLAISDGAVNAASDAFMIDIRGQQGHGARPHEAIDAVVVGSLLVTALQTIVSREVDPAHPSVVSVGRFDAGTAANVIAGTARLEGTIRSQEEAVRDHLCRSVERIAGAIGQLHDAVVEVRIRRGNPPVVNPPAMADLARRAAAGVASVEHVVPLRTVNMGSEDFGLFMEHVPGCYVRYGAQVAGREGYPAHSSRFDFDEAALITGADWLAAIARLAGNELR
jgi:hippurate hydrolase